MNYEISNRCMTVKIAATGAEMQSVSKDGVEYLWSGDQKYWPERAPILFPFVGRFTEGKYTLNGKEYCMGIHGFARSLPYRVVEHDRERIVMELEDTEETYESYPYHFVLRVSYELDENQIKIRYQVRNNSDKMMYFGIGGHPGFKAPLEDGLEFSDYYLEFSGKGCPDRVGHTETCFLNGINKEFPLEDGQKIRMRHDMFDDDAIVLQNMPGEVTLKSDKGTRSVTVSYPKMSYLGFWHAPKTEAPYICIEPWTSLPSRQDVVEEFSNKSDLVRLGTGETYCNQWSITIR